MGMMLDKQMSGPLTKVTQISDEEREKFHRQILSSVSHDLKTPLASIIGSLEVYERMSGRLTPEQQQSLISLALQEAYRLDTFITNILDMARLENGMVKRRQETVALRSLLEDCVTRLGHRLKNTRIHYAEPPQPVQALVDQTLLSRTICLVLDNAVKYGGTPSKIDIAYGKDHAGAAFISVADNGPGIPEARLDDVFSKYTRFARGDQQNAGTGLGLAICREIMRLLDGKIVAENNPDGGSIFTLTMPLA